MEARTTKSDNLVKIGFIIDFPTTNANQEELLQALKARGLAGCYAAQKQNGPIFPNGVLLGGLAKKE